MEPYKKMYFILFHAITDALQQLPAGSPVAEQLRQAQQQAEELYISQEEYPT